MAKNTNDEIIEKRESNPVATASIVLSTLAILFAIAFSMMEIAQYRTNLSVTGDRLIARTGVLHVFDPDRDWTGSHALGGGELW